MSDKEQILRNIKNRYGIIGNCEEIGRAHV